MNRREALKNLTLGIGYTVATPTLLGMLNSCKAKVKTWTPLFLSEQEKYIVTHLVDIILPKTDTPGALDVNVPQFLDMVYADVEKDANKNLFKKGATLFAKKFNETFNKETIKGEKQEFASLLKTYFSISPETEKQINKQQKLKVKDVSSDQMEQYATYKFLKSVRYYAIFGYCNSETVGESVLAYDPIPGGYQGCVSVDEATGGNAWSL